MNVQRLGNGYMDLVNKVLQSAYQSTPGYKYAEAAKNLESKGINPNSIQGMREPAVQESLSNIAMGMTTPLEARPQETITTIANILKARGTPDKALSPGKLFLKNLNDFEDMLHYPNDYHPDVIKSYMEKFKGIPAFDNLVRKYQTTNTIRPDEKFLRDQIEATINKVRSFPQNN